MIIVCGNCKKSIKECTCPDRKRLVIFVDSRYKV